MEAGRWEDAAGCFANAMRAAASQGRPAGQDAQVSWLVLVLEHWAHNVSTKGMCRHCQQTGNTLAH